MNPFDDFDFPEPQDREQQPPIKVGRVLILVAIAACLLVVLVTAVGR